MAIELEPVGGEVRYGTKGPAKFEFLMEGVLNRNYEYDSHEFTISGEKVSIHIQRAQPLPEWQCPSHPDIPEGHDWEWGDAWELSGYCRGYHVVGIYSVHSRKGVYHFWPIVPRGECASVHEDLHQFFMGRTNGEALLALQRAMEHMVRGTAVGGYHVDCGPCWELFGQLRRSCEMP